MLRILWTLIVVGTLIAGCPAPPERDATSGNEGGGGGDGGGGDGGGAGLGADDGHLPPGSGHSPPSEFDAPPEKSVTISGTVAYDGAQTGEIYVDFVQEVEGATPPARVVHSTKLETLGAWEVQAPKGHGKVDIVGFIDVNSNGPSPGEPIGAVHGVEIGDVDITGLAIELVDDDPNAGEPPPGELPPEEKAAAEGKEAAPAAEPPPAAAPPAAEPAPAAAGAPAEPAPAPATE